MWAAVASVVALLVVAVLNVALVVFFGGPDGSPVGDIVKQSVWALQAPLAGLILAARGERKESEQLAEDAGGVNVIALVILYGVTIFVIIQVVSFLFAGSVFVKDQLVGALCASGHEDRCRQIAPDALGAGAATVLIAGGNFAIVAALALFGVAGYRIAWRARRLGWLGAVLTPPLVAILMMGENLMSLFAFGHDVDASLVSMDWLGVVMARAPLGLGGIVAGLTGYLLSLRVNRPARRYGFAVARASRRRNADASALRNEFLNVLGFSSKEHELVVRRRETGGAQDKTP